MAPEQARGERVDSRCDLFSLGVVLYRLCTGQLPFRGRSTVAVLTALATERPRPVADLNPALPPALAELVMQLLAKDPAERPTSARAVADRLQAVERLLAAAAETPARSRGAAWKRRGLAAALVLAALLPLAYFFGGTIIRIATNRGELVIETDDPNIEVTIKGGGVTIHDKVKDRRFVLTAGDYDLEVREVGDGGVRFATKRFSITRGGKETFNARHLPWIDVNADRRAAKWVLSSGGSALVRVNGQDRYVRRLADLPKERFVLTRVNLLLGDELWPARPRRNPMITDAGLEHLKGLTNLTCLWLYGTQVGDAGMEHLKGLKKLTRLNLMHTRVSDAGLAKLKNLTHLRGLWLHDTHITDAGLEHIKGMTNLYGLGLDGTRVGDAGLERLQGLSNLGQLGLAGTQVSDAGMKHLKGLTKLQRLWLGGTRVGDAGLVHLKGLTKLEELYLPGTRVGDAGLERLKLYCSHSSFSSSLLVFGLVLILRCC
jgi:hypothetical protein